ncbi:PRC-barrel domain-containing protein [Dongia soli]|uniref:PRC-barrel domain-containing protein n=1 Tax=Dongia soli TaxID=600628 RepID=A0ABU5EEG9_9PROT|nr:PRC-barrel domain-containing protein [Dongia soli]MDY0884475.1 PRC-barrel domain-containing protein [Dongia soli]
MIDQIVLRSFVAMNRTVSFLALGAFFLVGASAIGWASSTSGGAHTEVIPGSGSSLTPEQKMERRFPQKVRVGDLIGLPLLDYDDRTMGRVTDVVRTAGGRIELISTCCGYFDLNRHQVAVPIETVAILARQIDVLDITREDFFGLERWNGNGDTKLGTDEMIRIAISRR